MAVSEILHTNLAHGSGTWMLVFFLKGARTERPRECSALHELTYEAEREKPEWKPTPAFGF